MKSLKLHPKWPCVSCTAIGRSINGAAVDQAATRHGLFFQVAPRPEVCISDLLNCWRTFGATLLGRMSGT